MATTSAISGGDEVNAVVIDLGTYLCRAGYSGDDTPKAVFPSMAGVVAGGAANGNNGPSAMEEDGKEGSSTGGRRVYVGNTDLMFAREGMEVVSPWGADDLIADWDIVEKMVAHALKDRLRIEPAENAIMFAEASHNTNASRERLVELLFERFKPPAVFLAKAAVLSSFAVGRQSSLVVDAGHRSTTVAAVHDGYVLQRSMVRTPLAGALMTQALAAMFAEKGVPIKSRHEIRRIEVGPNDFKAVDVDTSKLHPSFLAYHNSMLAADLKEALCRVNDVPFSASEMANIPTISYELPDGTEINVGSDRFKVPELFFQPQLLRTFNTSLIEPCLLPPDSTHSRGLPGIIASVINACDVDLRRELYGGIVLSGGSAMYGQLRERLEREVSELAPLGTKVKVNAPINPTERRFGAWIGGSILASLGSFQQMWMSASEFEEHGPGLIHRKAP